MSDPVYALSAVLRPRTLLRLGGIGVVVLAVVAAFAWTGGWLSPGRLEQRRLRSHYLLYGLMFALPLLGWAMLSAAAYPITLAGGWHLPPILPPDAALYALLRPWHTALAFLLFAVILVHLGAALMHALIFRDGVFESMTRGRFKSGSPD